MYQNSPVKPVSKALYMGFYLGGCFLGNILLFIASFIIKAGITPSQNGEVDQEAVTAAIGSGVFIIVIATPLLITGIVFMYILFYKMWAAIQDGHARSTPGQAVGFMFIPLFNFYWRFQVIWGYSKDYNEYLSRHSIQAKPLSEGIFLWACILPLLALIPFVGWVASIASLVLYIFVLNPVCDAINTLAYAQPQEAIAEAEYAPQQEPLQPEM